MLPRQILKFHKAIIDTWISLSTDGRKQGQSDVAGLDLSEVFIAECRLYLGEVITVTEDVTMLLVVPSPELTCGLEDEKVDFSFSYECLRNLNYSFNKIVSFI